MCSIVGVGLSAPFVAYHRAGFCLTKLGAMGSLKVSNFRILITDTGRSAPLKPALLLQGADSVNIPDIDGLQTRVLPTDVESDEKEEVHENGVVRAESLVIKSPDWRRTKSALESIGIKEAKAREDIYPGLRLSFFLVGTPNQRLILEMVAPKDPEPGVGDQPAKIWGVTWQVKDDLTAARGALHLPASLSPSRAAVQAGRQIATLKNFKGTRLAMAFITPSPRGSSS